MKVEWRIEIAPTGYRSLEEINDKKVLRAICQVIDGLHQNPDTQGKALVHPLEGLRSIRAAKDRYRIIYRANPADHLVSILLVGPRKAGQEDDIYLLAQKLLKNLLG